MSTYSQGRERHGGRGDGGRRDSGRRDGGGRLSGERDRGRSHGRDTFVGQRDVSGRGSSSHGGRGLTDRNRHMGNVNSIVKLVTNIEPRDIVAIVNPSVDEQNKRASKLDRYAPPGHESSVTLPGHSAWRNEKSIGTVLDPSKEHIIRTNHFHINTSRIPSSIILYAVHFYPIDRTGKVKLVDETPTIDIRKSTALITRLQDNHPEWNIGRSVGFAYNGKGLIYTTKPLPFPTTDIAGSDISHSEDIRIMSMDETTSILHYRVIIQQAEEINTGVSTLSFRNSPEQVLNALNSSIFAFARRAVTEDEPEWFLVGSQLFQSSSEKFELSKSYVALQGYYASLKICLSGVVLVIDMTASCFLTGGNIIQIIISAGNFRDIDHLSSFCKGPGISKQVAGYINEVIKNVKVRTLHLKRYTRAKKLGPASNSPDSKFIYEGKSITVADYYAIMCKTGSKAAEYRRVLPKGKLEYPELPCIDVGSAAKSNLIPSELLLVPSGQCRIQNVTGDITAKMIRHSAIRPDKRMNFLTNESSLVNIVRSSVTTQAFGIAEVEPIPMAVPVKILPSPKLCFGENKSYDPSLNGQWHFEDKKFIKSASCGGQVPYGILIISDQRPDVPNLEDLIQNFIKEIETNAARLGVNIKMQLTYLASIPNSESIKIKLSMLKNIKVKFVFVILNGDYYGISKLESDQLSITTQCLKWKNIENPPKSYHSNIMLKVNSKLGGNNHTLASCLLRGNATTSTRVFQYPPASLAWFCNEPFMLVGMDVSHAEIGQLDKESIAAIVASMDNKASQYCAYLTSQRPRQEIISALEDGMISLLNTYKRKNNGIMPKHIIVYRDGVSDGQFNEVNLTEIPAIKNAIALMGYTEDAVKVTVLVCQKRHHTRLTYEERGVDGSVKYINPCPGLVVDQYSTGAHGSITSAIFNEFYLNSHVAIQGTAKPCKYSLIYDEIGISMAEIELFTYWITHLYCRANKSVSYASPAYYAHWASKRGRYLHSVGANNDDLIDISTKWGNSETPMFFV